MKKTLTIFTIATTLITASCSMSKKNSETSAQLVPPSQPTIEKPKLPKTIPTPTQTVNKQTPTANPEKNWYTSEKLGVRFINPKHNDEITEVENKIMNPNWDSEQYIAVFHKSADEPIESAIEKLMKEAGNNPDNCRVETRGVENELGYQEYFVKYAKPITYTDAQKAEIKDAEENPDGPFDGEYAKAMIDNEIERAHCSYYEPELFARNNGRYLYNEKISQTTFILIQNWADPPFYGDIEIIK